MYFSCGVLSEDKTWKFDRKKLSQAALQSTCQYFIYKNKHVIQYHKDIICNYVTISLLKLLHIAIWLLHAHVLYWYTDPQRTPFAMVNYLHSVFNWPSNHSHPTCKHWGSNLGHRSGKPTFYPAELRPGGTYLFVGEVSLCNGQLMVRHVVNLVSRRKRDDRRIAELSLSWLHSNTNVVDPGSEQQETATAICV